MERNQDDADDRAAVLRGRAGAIEEIAVFVRRLALAAPTAADAETRLRACKTQWFDLAAWLNQAALETVEEMAVLRGTPEADARAGPAPDSDLA